MKKYNYYRQYVVFSTWLLVSFIFFTNRTSAQCREKLIETAIKNAGSNTLFVRDFSLNNAKKRSKLFMPVARYQVRLNEKYLYRFNIESDKENSNTGILQLLDDNILLASTFDSEKDRNEQFFDYYCKESKDYTVLMSFAEANIGCALGIMSVVLTDTCDLKQLENEMQSDNVLYIGIDNFLSIATEIPGAQLAVSTSSGNIEPENGMYKVRVEKPGKITLNVVSTDTFGNVIETTSTEFTVVDILPDIKLCGKSGGIISNREFIFGKMKLEIDKYPENTRFSLVEFTVCENRFNIGIKNQESEFLNIKQIKLLKNLNSGDSFYIKDILIKNESGTSYKLEPLGFIVE